jgi:hypothetical protein
LFNEDFSFFAGSVVNHPHCSALHRFTGAYPPETYHWPSDVGAVDPPLFDRRAAPVWWYGRNMYDTMGSQVRGW